MSLAAKVVCWQVTRSDGIVLRGTTNSRDVRVTDPRVTGLYMAESGIAATVVRANADLSVDNLEAAGAFFSTLVQAVDIEAGVFDGAPVIIFEVPPEDTSTARILRAGTLGQQTRKLENTYTFEVRGRTQPLAQPIIEAISKKCRVKRLGDARCKLDLTALTFTGIVLAVQGSDAFTDAGLDQAGVVVSFLDQDGATIPADAPYTLGTIPPSGGTFVEDLGAFLEDGTPLIVTAGDPDNGEYEVDAGGNYFFNAAQSGKLVFRNFTYEYGFFVDGTITWLTGANKGYSNIIRAFSPAAGGNPASVQLFLPQPRGIAPGDTYSIVAGCNRLYGVCLDRFNNLLNFRGEPFAPGPDALARVLG